MVNTEHFGYGELYNEVNIHTGGIRMVINTYPDANSVDMFSQRAYIETTVPDMPQTDYVVVRDSKLPALYAQYEKLPPLSVLKHYR